MNLEKQVQNDGVFSTSLQSKNKFKKTNLKNSLALIVAFV